MNRGNGGIFGKKNSSSLVGGMYSSYEKQEKSASVYWPSGPDSNFAYTPLLLKTGPQASPKTTVTDSSVNNFTVTKSGTPSTGWTSPYQTPGYWSWYFGVANTDYLSPATSASLAFGNNPYTVEFWIYMLAYTGSNNRVIDLGISTGSFGVQINNTGTISITKAGAADIFTSSSGFTLNQWNHVAVVRTSTSTNGTAIYLNGTNVGTTTDSNNWTVVNTPRINGYPSPALGWTGYLSNLRVVNGTSVYTGNFTPSTIPLTAIPGTALLTCQDNRFKDNSTNNLTLTVAGTPQVKSDFYPSGFTAPVASLGAAYFNGTTDYLTVATNTAFQYGTGNFTAEAWVYRSAAWTAQNILFGQWSGSTGGTTLSWVVLTSNDTNGYARFALSNTGGTVLTDSISSTVIPLNQWNHIALVRNGSTFTLYLNGISVVTYSSALSLYNATNTLSIGASSAATQPFNGYISNLRIVNGVAAYTGNFTPPTDFLTQIGGTYTSTSNVVTSIASSNTSLLLNLTDTNTTSITDGANNNVFIDSSPYALTLTRNGTPTQGSFTPYLPNGNWSNYLDGSSYINFTTLNGFLTTGPCTIEAWVNCSSFSSSPSIVDNSNWNIGQNCGWRFYINSTGTIAFLASIGTFNVFPAVLSTTASITINTWNHIAFIRDSSNVCRIYINGVDGGGSVTYSASFAQNSGTGYRGTEIGRLVADGTTYQTFTGFISNVRIVNGTAVYTAPFTPPTSELIPVTGTALLTCQSNRFVDNSVSNLAPTLTGTPKIQKFQPLSSRVYSPSLYGGSGYFNGSSDSVSTSQTFALPTSTTPFTMEAWVNFSSFSGVAIASSAYAGSGPIPFVMGMASSTAFSSSAATPMFAYYNGSAWTVAVQSSTSLSLNTWYHLAYVYTGSTATIYANGVSIGSASVSSWQTTSQAGFYVGRRWDTASPAYFNGYISNFRLVIGTAVYTGTFTPPTLTPLTFDGQTSAVSYANTANVNTSFGRTQTSLLTNFNNTAIYDAVSQNDLININTPQAVSVPSKFPSTTSIKFNGTSDYLTTALTPNLQFNTGDFTVECWSYLTSKVSNFPTIFGNYNSYTTGALALFAGHNSATTTQYQVSINGGAFPATAIQGGTILYNTWVHLALVRYNGIISLYVNGTSVGTPSSSAVTLNGVGSLFYIGTAGDNVANGYINGYIQDFRVSKVARYTANFAVPTLPFGSSGRSLSAPTVIPIEYLVVAGGGSAGVGGSTSFESGGGGAGGMLTGTNFITSSTYSITVGAGGSNSNGSDSILSAIVTATGGGKGASNAGAGSNGGSGGGGTHNGTAAGTGIVGQGKNGGAGATSAGGGGGGAGVVGTAGVSTGIAGAGGNGLQSSITGVATYYAGGGGGGGGGVTPVAGAGSLGGGAAGSITNTGIPGTPNTGGGGGGSASSSSSVGGAGGSGIVIIAYPTSYPTLSFISSGLTYTVDTTNRPGYIVYKFTAGTGTISW